MARPLLPAQCPWSAVNRRYCQTACQTVQQNNGRWAYGQVVRRAGERSRYTLKVQLHAPDVIRTTLVQWYWSWYWHWEIAIWRETQDPVGVRHLIAILAL